MEGVIHPSKEGGQMDTHPNFHLLSRKRETNELHVKTIKKKQKRFSALPVEGELLPHISPFLTLCESEKEGVITS
jgi:hypothetical protein